MTALGETIALAQFCHNTAQALSAAEARAGALEEALSTVFLETLRRTCRGAPAIAAEIDDMETEIFFETGLSGARAG